MSPAQLHVEEVDRGEDEEHDGADQAVQPEDHGGAWNDYHRRWGEVRGGEGLCCNRSPCSMIAQPTPPAPWRMREALVADQTAAWLIQNPGRDLNKCFPLSDVWSGGCGQFYFNINSKGFVLWISSRAPRLLWPGIIETFSNQWSREIWLSKYFYPKFVSGCQVSSSLNLVNSKSRHLEWPAAASKGKHSIIFI